MSKDIMDKCMWIKKMSSYIERIEKQRYLITSQSRRDFWANWEYKIQNKLFNVMQDENK